MCDTTFDATIEEVLHLINSAGTAELYPDQWKAAYSSTVGGYLKTLNGDCGNGYSGDFVDPTTKPDTCSYAYNDETCDESCIVIEGIYWSLTSYLGAQYYSGSRAPGEWLLNTPDSSMTPQSPAQSNWGTMEGKASDLYSLVSTSSQSYGKWLPSKVPNGNYGNTPKIVEPSCTDSISNLWQAIGLMFEFLTQFNFTGVFATWAINWLVMFVPF